MKKAKTVKEKGSEYEKVTKIWSANKFKTAKPSIRVESRPAKRLMTVVRGLQSYGNVKLREMAAEIQAAKIAVATAKQGVIEVQGDKLAQVKAWFAKQK